MSPWFERTCFLVLLLPSYITILAVGYQSIVSRWPHCLDRLYRGPNSLFPEPIILLHLSFPTLPAQITYHQQGDIIALFLGSVTNCGPAPPRLCHRTALGYGYGPKLNEHNHSFTRFALLAEPGDRKTHRVMAEAQHHTDLRLASRIWASCYSVCYHNAGVTRKWVTYHHNLWFMYVRVGGNHSVTHVLLSGILSWPKKCWWSCLITCT